MKIAVVTSRFPYPLEKGDKLRLYFQIKYLSLRHEIILLSLEENPISESSLKHIQNFCKSVYTFPIQKNKAKLNALKAFTQKTPLEVGYFFNKKIKTQIEEIIHTEKPDHIYCQLIRMSEYVRQLPYPKTLDYMDAFSLGMSRRAENSSWFLRYLLKKDAQRIAKYESEVFSDFQNHSIISLQDRNHLSFLKKEEIHVLPNGVDTDFFKPQSQVEQKYDLAFIGNMGYYPNVQAAIFLGKKILPKLLTKKNNLKILIAGARPNVSVKNLANQNITITGWVEDIRTAYAASKIFIAPIFHGRGQQNKILEAMAMGIPCITSDQVNKAIGAIPGESILIANDVESCQEQISLLLENVSLQQQLSEQGLQFIQKNFSWEKYGQQLEQILCLKEK